MKRFQMSDVSDNVKESFEKTGARHLRRGGPRPSVLSGTRSRCEDRLIRRDLDSHELSYKRCYSLLDEGTADESLFAEDDFLI